MPIDLTAAENDDGRRLDRILRKALPDMPLSAIHRLLRKGGVLVDGKKAAIDRRVKAGQTITLPESIFQKELNHVEPEVRVSQSKTCRTRGSRNTEKKQRTNQKLRGRSFFPDITLFEGAGLLVLNKPAGLPVHGRESLEDLVRSYLEPKLSPSLSFKPGPLHRLDRPSSGIVAFSTSLEGARFFSAMMRNRMIKKQYLALVEGVIKEAEVWEDELVRDGRQKKSFRSVAKHGKAMFGISKPGETKTALTRVSPLAGDGERTLILAEIETGRTHQIRAQAAGRGHPLVGDRKYGGASDSGGEFFLHAWRMEFPEKTDNNLYEGFPQGLPRLIVAPLPENFLEKIQKIFGKGIISDPLSQL
ncbi:MAG: RluA family pseudouridine synthase [Treponema sp.]|jgi:23S rRNA pseudouridine955/2504/2580 synthase|nr:RluA family pseudouridine synthase [Treponema sp.]